MTSIPKRRPAPSTIDVATLRANVHRLRTTIRSAYELLVAGKAPEAQEALAIDADAAAAAPLVIASHTTRVEGFVQAFNRLCRLHGMPAAVAIPIPSKLDEGMVRITLGGHSDTVKLVAKMMDNPAAKPAEPAAPALVPDAVPG